MMLLLRIPPPFLLRLHLLLLLLLLLLIRIIQEHLGSSLCEARLLVVSPRATFAQLVGAPARCALPITFCASSCEQSAD